MTVLEIATRGRTLSVRNGLLRLGDTLLHPDDIDMVIAEVPAVTITGDALWLLSRSGIELVVCDRQHLPTATLWPVATGATLSAGVLRDQATLSLRRRSALWRQIVRAKITEQARHLVDLGQSAARLAQLSRNVAQGDPSNLEAQAARHYWQGVFGKDFRRQADDETNARLNFGYAVVRAVIARQLHTAGLHRSLGVHHCSGENDGNLADDLLEPFRPSVDRAVRDEPDRPFDAAERERLAAMGSWPVRMGGRWVQLRTAAGHVARSFRDVVNGGPARLALPQAIGNAEDARRMAEDVGAGLL